MDHDKRLLTDEDIKALADELEGRLVSRFYTNLGKGVWSIVWKAIVVGSLMLAAYGSFKNFNH